MGEAASIPRIPVLRAGVAYHSLDEVEVTSHRDGTPMARVSQANAGIIRRDLRRIAGKTAAFRSLSVARLLEITREAGRLFLEESLPISDEGDTQSPDEYVSALSATSGLPHALCRRNMEKVHSVFEQMPRILSGLTRGMDLAVIDELTGEHCGIPVCYVPTTHSLGAILPSNSPGVNSIWMPAIPLKIPVILKPGREEPWTPQRIVRAFIGAGCPPEAFSLYPTDHEGSAAVLERAGRSLLFGDENTTRPHANNASVRIHGPGRSKILVGRDAISDWRRHLGVMCDSVASNGGRSCINASTIFVPQDGDAVADALARDLAAITPRPFDDPEARLAAFANPAFATYIDGAIEKGLAAGGAEDVTAKYREGPRLREIDGVPYVLPTVIRCDDLEHELARTEFLFPFVSVVEVPHEDMVAAMGPSLVVSAFTEEPGMIDALLRSRNVDRLNLGPVPTSAVEWDQPHEGNLFEFLYARRAFQRAPRGSE